MEVNAVEQGAGDSFKVLLHAAGLAGALAKDVAEIAAGAGVHGGNEGEIGGIGVGGVDTGYLHNAIFERLRSTSRASRANSGSSSRKRTPWCARLTSPGRGMVPPPTRAAVETVW